MPREDEIVAVSSFRFGSLWIVQSLPAGESSSGESLANRLRLQFAAAEVDFPVFFMPVDDERQLREALAKVAERAAAAGPILHLEMHGDGYGLALASGEVIRWSDLRGDLARINLRCRNNLLVTLAVCRGQFLFDAAVAATRERAPFWMLLGAEGDLSYPQLSLGFADFYKKLLIDRDFKAARKAIDEIRGRQHTPFRLILSDLVFRDIAKGALDEYRSREAQEARVDRLVHRVIDEQGWADSRHREYFRNQLKPENQIPYIEQLREQFLMIDLYPEVAERSLVSAERIVRDWLSEQELRGGSE